MANSKQAIKRARQNTQHAKHNASQRTMARSAIKRVRKAIATNDADAKSIYQQTTTLLDKLANRHRRILNPNRVARIKSRLNKQLKAKQTA